MSRFKVGDIVAVHGEIDGYVTDTQFIPELGVHIFFVETTTFCDWFRASDLIKLYRCEMTEDIF